MANEEQPLPYGVPKTVYGAVVEVEMKLALVPFQSKQLYFLESIVVQLLTA